MKYTETIEINASRDSIWDGLVKEENLKKIHPTVVSTETVEGNFGEQGSTTKMIFEMNGREMVMTENILEIKEKELHKAEYDADGVHNVNELTIKQIGDNKYEVSITSEFSFSGIMKLMSLFMKGSFKKETSRALEALKEFAESN